MSSKRRRFCSNRCFIHSLAFTCIIGIVIFCVILIYLYSTADIGGRNNTFRAPYFKTSIENRSFKKETNKHIFHGNKNLFNRRNGTTSSNDHNLYYIISQEGFTVYDTITLEMLDHLNVGSLVILSPYIINIQSNQSLHCPEQDCLKLFVSFPLSGYILSNNFLNHLQSVDIVIDNRCHETLFMRDIDILGGDLPRMPTNQLNTKACCFECTITDRCNSWSFTSEGSCWLKHVDDLNKCLIAQ
jgi:hypothetical protein